MKAAGPFRDPGCSKKQDYNWRYDTAKILTLRRAFDMFCFFNTTALRNANFTKRYSPFKASQQASVSAGSSNNRCFQMQPSAATAWWRSLLECQFVLPTVWAGYHKGKAGNRFLRYTIIFNETIQIPKTLTKIRKKFFHPPYLTVFSCSNR